MFPGSGNHANWCFATILLFLPWSLAADIVSKSVSVPSVCLNGAYNLAGKCVCNPGFSEYKGNCFLTNAPTSCPPGSVLWQGRCKETILPPTLEIIPAQERYIVVPPLRVTLPTPDPLDPNFVEEEGEDNDDEEMEEVNILPPRDKHLNVSYRKIVNNHNVINNETTVNSHTVNNVIVQIMRKKANGAIRTVVIRNNETTVHEEEPSRKPPSSATRIDDDDCMENSTTTEVPKVDPPCCTIVSPRVCRKQQDEWVCFHRKQYVCSTVCTAAVMYLKPRKPQFQHPWLIMPPMPNYPSRIPSCHGGLCPKPDCSGCLRGRSRCHPMCYTYDCMKDDSCHFLDQQLICNEMSGQVCSLFEDKTVELREQAKVNVTVV